MTNKELSYIVGDTIGMDEYGYAIVDGKVTDHNLFSGLPVEKRFPKTQRHSVRTFFTVTADTFELKPDDE